MEKENTCAKKSNKNYDLKNNAIFQYFFTKEGGEKFLAGLLNALFDLKIKSIEMDEHSDLENFKLKDDEDIFSFLAKMEDDSIIPIDMQIKNYESEKVIMLQTFFEKMYRIYNYKDLDKIYIAKILNYIFLEDCEDYISEIVIVLNGHEDYVISKDMKAFILELPKFRKAKLDMNEKINQWIVFIDNSDKELVKVATEKNKLLHEAKTELNNMLKDKKVIHIAELNDKNK